MNNTINEYDQIRNMLGIVRQLTEQSNPLQQGMTSGQQQQPVQQAQQPQQQTPAGEKIMFDDIKTVGFLKSQSLPAGGRNAFKQIVGEFIKNTGLILDTVNITVEDNHIIITSDTIKNPNISTIKSITFDTNQDNPVAEVISGTVEISSDLTNLFQSIMLTYEDNQIGRNALVSATQQSQM